MDNLQGKLLKGYKLEDCIGFGGFGEVYRARQSTIGREVAIKIIVPTYANNPDFIRRFESEAHLIARLEHPHITPLHDFWRDAEGAYLVMRYLKGGSVRNSLQEGAYELNAVSQLLDQLASALDFAHRNSVIHRDIKPSNILLDEDGNAYLADFGIAKDLASISEDKTAADAVVGSLDYISPEQARSDPVTPRTDIYSLGVTLYEMITGEHPFKNTSTIERLYKHINDPLPEITNLPINVADTINEIIACATAKNPDERYPDVLSLAVAFREGIGRGSSSQDANIVEQLTMREQEVLALMVQNLSNREIADELVVTMATVKWHITQLYKKLGVRSRVQAIVRARELNLIVGADASDDMLSLATSPTSISLPEPDNPYKGLHAFQMTDARDFFGRDELIKKLIEQMTDGDPLQRFLAIVGPSGSGKSSLVKAGLIPALWKGAIPDSEKWFVVDMIPGTHPLDKLETALIRVAANHSGSLHEQLYRDERGLLRVADIILPADKTELIIVIDQFEEVFTLVESEESRQRFLDLIRVAISDVRSRVRVILTLRADYYDRPLHYADFGELIRKRMETVLPLSVKGLERAIRGPAERVGVTFEQGLVEQIVSTMNYQSGALPLLQYALTELFDRRQGRLLTHEAYQQIGGAVGALANRADEIYRSLTVEAQELTQQMFMRLVTLGDGAEDSRRRTTQTELFSLTTNTDLMEEIIDQFAAYRLLSLDHDPKTRNPTVEVAHEAILREWERLRLWLNSSRAEIRQRHLTSQAAEAWSSNNRDSSYLLSGIRLSQAENWYETTSLTLTPLEHEFILASVAEAEMKEQAEAARLAREKAQERRSQTLLRVLVAVFGLALMIAIALSLFALSQRNRAHDERDKAEAARAISERNEDYASSIALASAANSAQLLNNPDQAIALAINANQVMEPAPSFAQSTLFDVAFVPATQRVFSGMNSTRFAVSPDGRTALFIESTENSYIHLNLMSGEVLAEWSLAETNAPQICLPVIGPDSTTGYVTVTSDDFMTGAIIAVDLENGQEIQRFSIDAGYPCGLSFSADRQQLTAAIFSPVGVNQVKFTLLRSWDIQTGTLINDTSINPPESGDGTRDAVVMLSDDRQQLLVSSSNGQVSLLEADTGALIRIYGEEASSDTSPEFTVPYFTPAGIATVSTNSMTYTTTATLWNEQTGEMILREMWQSPINSVALSPDGKHLALGFVTPQITLFDLTSGEKTGLYGHTFAIAHLAFTPDNRYLLSTSFDGTLRRWNLEHGAELAQIEGFNSVISGLVISPDGMTAAAQEYMKTQGGRLGIWDLHSGELIQTLGYHQDMVRGIAFSPDGRTLVAGSATDFQNCSAEPGTITLYNLNSGERIWETQKDTGSIFGGVTFTQDGSRILSVDWACENFVSIWDAATGAKIGQWEGHQAPVSAISASTDGTLIATGSRDMTAMIRNSEDGAILHQLQHDTPVVTTTFSPDNQLLLTAGLNGVLHLYNVQTGQEIRRMTGHNGNVTFVQFSPDGRYLVSSGGADSNIFVWDIQTGEVVRRFNLPSVSPLGSAVAFAPDGRSIFMMDQGNILRHIDLMLNPGELLAWVNQNRHVRELTCSERDLYRVEPLCAAD